MSNAEFKEELYRRLLELPVAKPVNPTQLVVRCPFCGDSMRDTSHGHMYIKIDVHNDNIPVMYNCFRAVCGEHGVMNSDVLRMLEIHDLEMCSSLTRYNKKAVNKLVKQLGFKTGKLKYTVPLPRNVVSNLRKKKYIEERMGISLTAQDMVDLKIVLSLKEFLLYNKIENITCKDYIARQIEDDYIGFLSVKNNFIVFRDITGNHKERYIKYTIEKDILNEGTFYAIPVGIDIVSSDKIEIHIAEGTFDIIGVYHHITNKDNHNKIYVSVCGGNYLKPIEYFLSLGLIGNIDIHIYSDQGLKPSFYKKTVKNKFGIWVDNIFVHYNELEKDCGVTKDKISLITYEI